MTDFPCHSLPPDQWCDRNGERGGFMGHTCQREPVQTLTREELLILLIEECGEVIQAATKCLRFGFEREWPGYGKNDQVLSTECGDLIGYIDALPLDRLTIMNARNSKIVRAMRAKVSIGNPDKADGK